MILNLYNSDKRLGFDIFEEN